MVLDKITKEYVDKVFLDEEEYLGNNKMVNQTVPKVSVWVITYNQEKYISECIDSILMQEVDFDYEIVIGEDGSSDNTREICKKYAEKYPDKIRLFLRDREKSAIYDRNGKFKRSINSFLTLKACRGMFIAFCEGDDRWSDVYKLSKQVDILINNDTISIVGTNSYIFNCRTKSTSFLKVANDDIIFTADSFYLDSPLITTASMIVDKKVVEYLLKNEFILNATVLDFFIKSIAMKYGNLFVIAKYMVIYNQFVENSWSSLISGEDKILSNNQIVTELENRLFLLKNNIVSFSCFVTLQKRVINRRFYQESINSDCLFESLFLLKNITGMKYLDYLKCILKRFLKPFRN